MSAQRGRDLLLKFDPTPADANTAPVTVAGLRSRRMAFNARPVDVTDGASVGRWRELLAGAGVQSASLSGSGIFKDRASDEAIRAAFFAATIGTWQIVLPDFGTVEGPFQIVALEYGAEHDGEVTFEIALESAGALLFEVAP